MMATAMKTILFLVSKDSPCRALTAQLTRLGYLVREVHDGRALRGSGELLGQPDLILLELEECSTFLARLNASDRLNRSIFKRRGSQVEAILQRLRKILKSPVIGVSNQGSQMESAQLRKLGFVNCIPAVLSEDRLEKELQSAVFWKALCEATGENEVLVDRIGDYELLEKLGEGASGIVFKARKQGTRRFVALKLLKRECADLDEIMRFRREIAALGTIHHQNIVGFIESGVHNGCYYYVMTYVLGRTIYDTMNEKGAVEPRLVVKWVRAVALALAELHEKGFVHRDVKPANVLLSQSGPVLTDFGVVRSVKDRHVTQSGVVVGTPGFLAPEVIQGQQPSPASDLFSLGMMATEMLLGEDQFGPTLSLVPLMQRVMTGRFLKPSKLLQSFPKLGKLLDTLVVVDPKRRCQSARQFVRALDQLTPIPVQRRRASQ